jgi:hypothetical protein
MAAPSGPVKWQVDSEGNLLHFDLRVLRSDILFRLRTGHPLYTTEECRTFLTEVIRTATRWQEEELGYLIYLAEMHNKVLPGHQVNFQWPVTFTQPIPFSAPVDALHDTPVYRVTKVVEELNRSMVRVIDRLWNERRERLLLAASMLEGLEGVMSNGQGGDDN